MFETFAGRLMFEHELRVVKHAVHEAGEAITSIADRYYQTAMKQAGRTIVTKADIEADRILQNHLRGEFPEYGWLSEETKEDDRRFLSNRVWIVDALDGTREFVMKVPEFAVSVALAEQGEIVLGIILNPCTGDLFEAVQGKGTRLNGQPVHCNHRLHGVPEVEVSRSDLEKGRLREYENCLELRPRGSIAYKLARLAAGKADGTLSITPKNEWDIAGGLILVAEAGGRVTDLAGKRHRFNQARTLVNGVIAASSAAYDAIRRAVDERNMGTVPEPAEVKRNEGELVCGMHRWSYWFRREPVPQIRQHGRIVFSSCHPIILMAVGLGNVFCEVCMAT